MAQTTAPAYQPLGTLSPLKLAAIPTFLGVFAYVGPGILWAASAQGSGELIWWPYLTAKYGAAFLGLLIPAALLQYWLNIEICRYVAVTGETPMTGFTRMSRGYAWLLFIGIFIENIWFGAYASGGGTALAALTGFPAGWGKEGQSLFWGFLTIAIYLSALVFGRVAYTWVENISKVIVVVTMVGIIFALFQQPVLAVTGEFFRALIPHWTSFSEIKNWDPADLDKVVMGIAFAGVGGFFQIAIGYWMRDKGLGMGQNMGRVTSPITGQAEAIPATGFYFADTEENKKQYRGWMCYIGTENFIGVSLNLITTAIMCWLAYALLLPKGEIPKGWDLAVVQSAFFEVSWGAAGRALFLVVAAAFLCDAWLQLTDGLSRIQSDFVYANFKRAQKLHYRVWYYIFVAFFTIATTVTLSFGSPPDTLMTIRGVISFLAMAIICPGVVYLNYVLLPRAFPSWVKPHPVNRVIMILITLTYIALAYWYLSLSWPKLLALLGA